MAHLIINLRNFNRKNIIANSITIDTKDEVPAPKLNVSVKVFPIPEKNPKTLLNPSLTWPIIPIASLAVSIPLSTVSNVPWTSPKDCAREIVGKKNIRNRKE